MDWVLLAVRITLDALRFAHVTTYSENDAVLKYVASIPEHVRDTRSYNKWRMSESPMKEMEDGQRAD